MSKRWLTPVLCASLLSACAAAGGDTSKQEDAKPDATVEVGDTAPDGADTSEQPPPLERNIELAIASVQMIQDCPDPPEPSPATKPSHDQPAAPAQGAARRRAKGDGNIVQPCDQSTMQLTLQIDGDAPQTVRIAAIRLLDKQGKPVGELSSRKPSVWIDQGYTPWDETVAPGAALKVSYKLSLPNWAAVEKATGEASYGYTFKLEIDVEIGGELRTVQSPAFPREQPHVIVT